MSFSPRNIEHLVRRILMDASLSPEEKIDRLDQIWRLLPAWVRKYPDRVSELLPGLAVDRDVAQLLAEDLEVQRDKTDRDLADAKAAFAEYRDWFIGLSDPTPEQASEFREVEYYYRTCVGEAVAFLKNNERALRLLPRFIIAGD